MSGRPLVVVSNRGPIAHTTDATGAVVRTKTGGGLASGLKPALEARGGQWFCVPLNHSDDLIAEHEPEVEVDGVRVSFVGVEAAVRREAVEAVANRSLWFVHHGMTSLATAPHARQWDSFGEYNASMARACIDAADDNAIVLVQDYHLPAIGGPIRSARKDLGLVHFSHTPFADPRSWATMPQQRRRVITAGMADHDACGFHSQRWADRFLACCELDGVNPPQTFIAPLAPDISGMAAAAGSEGALRERARLDELRTSQQLIVRVDRLEPTKNLVAGFEAFEQLLERRPDLVGRVTMVAYAYPSRSDLAPYRDLRHAVVRTVAAINDRHGSNDWTPVLLDLEDDLEAAAAGLTCYDVLLVNPVEDGLNLVVFEGAGLNQTHGTAVLSRTCGAHDQLRDVVESIDPIDVDDTSMALERALGLPPDERRSRSQSARTITMDQSSTGWIERLISAVG